MPLDFSGLPYHHSSNRTGYSTLSDSCRGLSDYGLVPIISLAKGEEEIYVPGLDGPLQISKDGKASLYLQEIRDEAHRFAIAYNRLLRKKAITE
jgi:excinuclease ABC subunit C